MRSSVRRPMLFTLIATIGLLASPAAIADNQPGVPGSGEPGLDFPPCQICQDVPYQLNDRIIFVTTCVSVFGPVIGNSGRECEPGDNGCRIRDYCMWA